MVVKQIGPSLYETCGPLDHHAAKPIGPRLRLYISRGPWPIDLVIGAVWDARGTEEIARALKGVDSDLENSQRRRPWDAVACERYGKLQSAYSDDPTEPPGERPRYG